jgi:hypothetical protein
VVDWLAVLWLVAESEQKRTLLDLKTRLAKLEHPCEGIVPIVRELERRTDHTLARL